MLEYISGENDGLIMANLWTRIFHVRPHSIGETRFFICEKLILEKLESPLILFLF